MKVAVGALAILLSMAVLARLSLKSSLVHDYVKTKIEEVASKNLNGHITISELKGDLWNEVQLQELAVIGQDTLAKFNSIKLSYNLLSYLWGPFIITDLEINGVQATIRETEDGVYNTAQILKSTSDGEASGFLVQLEHIRLNNGEIAVYAPSSLPDSLLKITELNLEGRLSLQEQMEGRLSSLDFRIIEGRLPDPINVSGRASYQNERITLERIVLETSRSVISTTATAGLQDSTINAGIQARPLALADLNSLIDYNMLDDELNADVSVTGVLGSMNLDVELTGNSLRNVNLVTKMDLTGTPSVSSLVISGDYLNLAALTNNKMALEMHSFRASARGNIISDPQKMNIAWDFDSNRLKLGEYYLKRITGEGSFNKDEFVGNADITSEFGDQVAIHMTGSQMFGDMPVWKGNAYFTSLDISDWIPDSELKSTLNVTLAVEGSGYELSERPWRFIIEPVDARKAYKLEDGTIQFSNQPMVQVLNDENFSDFSISGEISEMMARARGFIQLDSSRVRFETSIEEFLKKPRFSYSLEAHAFNMAEVNVLSDFPTSVNLKASGTGTGTGRELDKLVLNGTLLIDSSLVNGASLQQIESKFEYHEGILTITQGVLESDIASGHFTARKNLTDPSDTENQLIADLKLNNTQPLAPLFKVDILNAQGKFKALITQNNAGILELDADIDLNDIVVDDKLTADHIEGEASVAITEFNEYTLSLNVEKPVVQGVVLQDIEVEMSGLAGSDSLNGVYQLNIKGSERGKIFQQGNFELNTKEFLGRLQLTRFDFSTQNRQLELTKPFSVFVQGRTVRTDTLRLDSDEGAYFRMAIPYADSLEQRAWLKGQNFNFGLLQDVLFGEIYVDGILSGEAQLDRRGSNVRGKGAVSVGQLTYRGVQTDLIEINFELEDKRLVLDGRVMWDGEEHITGTMNVPFVLENPEKINESFFNQPVEGSLTIRPTRLQRFRELLETFDIIETDGIISFSGSMSGVAGMPDFRGRMSLREPVLSGIRIDSAFASFSYDQKRTRLQISSEITAGRQKAAILSASIPLFYDFRGFELHTPGEEDTVQVIVKTEDFNISVFNDFLNKEYMARLRGTLNGNLKLEGSIDKLIPSGTLTLSKGGVRVPVAGISLENIRSNMEFTGQGLKVQEIFMNSGKGELKASGNIALEGVVPSTIDLRAKATQFQLANTTDLNIIIGMDAKLSGKATTPTASGNLSIRSGFVYLDNFGDSEIEEIQLEGEEMLGFSPYDSLAIDMNFSIGDNFFVRNRGYLDMEIELTGSLEAQKEKKKELQLFGTLNGKKGYIRPLGKRFDIQEADYMFSGPIENPRLSIRSMYIPQTAQKQGEQFQLYYIIEGTQQEPEFRFDSQPQMEESDIICYTLFNRTCTQLEGWQSAFLDNSGASPENLLAGILLDEVEQIATRKLGIDVVQIDNTKVGSETGTSIKTGWYLNSKTFFSIVNEIVKGNPKMLFILEYILTDRMDLILTGGSDTGRQGLDIRWQYDY